MFSSWAAIMRIASEDQRCHVEIRPTNQGYGIGDLKAHVDTGHGEFSFLCVDRVF